jgi:curved DNA-binding protein CbpA
MATSYNLYDILGVEPSASEAEIRTAFRKLSLKHHPDRFAGDERMKAEEHFQGITEAFNVLSRPDSREKYDHELSQGQTSPAAMDAAEIARRLASKGATTLREGNVAEALAELKSALDHDEDCARAHYFMGVALAKVKGREKEAFRHLERSTVLEPENAVMLAETASIALTFGMKAKAQRLAEKALSFDPTNEKALTALEASVEDEKTQSGEGLFGRLRRRG